jgi:hypothetical protein
MSIENQIAPEYRNTAYINPKWVMFIDPETGKPFFFNTETGDTSWDDPDPPSLQFLRNPERDSNPPSDASPARLLRSDNDHATLEKVIESEISRGTPPYLSDSWRNRPARRQSDRDLSKIAYKEGSEKYNIWYHRFSTDRFDDSVRIAATTICDPWIDSGWTQADLKHAQSTPFCLWFARGCCSKGELCRYKHRVPTKFDDENSDQMIDIFGRERHANHKDDMGGVGSFLKECKSLYISEIELEESVPDSVQKLEAQIWKLFHPWGPIVSVRVIPSRRIAFVRFEYRSAAEFAKVACANQPCGISDAINVRWAFEDPNPRATEQAVIDTKDEFFCMIEKRIASMSMQERRSKGLLPPADSSGADDILDRFQTCE